MSEDMNSWALVDTIVWIFCFINLQICLYVSCFIQIDFKNLSYKINDFGILS